MTSGGSRGVSTVSTETRFELVYVVSKRLSVSLQLEAVKTAAATFIASMCLCIKRGHGDTVDMRMKPRVRFRGGGGGVLRGLRHPPPPPPLQVNEMRNIHFGQNTNSHLSETSEK